MQLKNVLLLLCCLLMWGASAQSQQLSEFEQLLPRDEKGLLFGLAKNASITGIAEGPTGNYLLTERNGCYFMPHGQEPSVEIGALPIDRRDKFLQLTSSGSDTYLWANGNQIIDMGGDVDERLSYIGDHFTRNVSPTCFEIDADGRVIVGTAKDGLFIFRPGDYGNYSDVPVRISTFDEQLPSNIVNCLYRDERGVIWIGTDKGVATFYQDSVHNLSKTIILEGETWLDRLFGYYEEVPTFQAPVKAITRWGNSMLFLSDDGLTKTASRVDSLAQVYTFNLNDRLTVPLSNLKGMVTDINGDVWIYGDQLVRYNIASDQLARISENLRFRGRSFTALQEDLARNCMWIGTKRGGLYRYDF